ncbi:chorismate mutase [Terriglobus saanensis]|nr:chorismate mutase [Terriglobus saanensis]
MSIAIVAFAVVSISNVHAQSSTPIDRLQPLVEASAQRLALADQVALAKWDSGMPIEDATREASVIAGAVKSGESKDLDSVSVANFFKAQIESNKIVQYGLLAKWRRSGGAPKHAPIDLVATIRPQLDWIQIALVTALAETKAMRSDPACKDDVAKAVGKYLALHKRNADALHAIALDRSLAATCAR